MPVVVDLPAAADGGDAGVDLQGRQIVVVADGTGVGERLRDLLAGAGAAASLVATADATGAVAPGLHTLVDLTALDVAPD